MANSDKKILITPATNTTNYPSIDFTGADNNTVTLTTYDDGMLGIHGSTGQLLSISDSYTNEVYSVSDASGMPSITVADTGGVHLAPIIGRAIVGSTEDNGLDTLQVHDSFSVYGDSGSLMSVTDYTEDPTLYSVTDRSGVPSIRVMDDGAVYIASHGGWLESPKIHSVGMPCQIVNGLVTNPVFASFTTGQTIDWITGITFTPKFGNSKFKIDMIFPVNTSDDPDNDGASNGNTNPYLYGRVYRSVSGGAYVLADGVGVSAQGGQNAHIELSPNRTGNNGTDYWSGNRYRMEHKHSVFFDYPSYSLGESITYKVSVTSHSGTLFLQVGEPNGFGGDDNYPCQPWGVIITEIPQ